MAPSLIFSLLLPLSCTFGASAVYTSKESTAFNFDQAIKQVGDNQAIIQYSEKPKEKTLAREENKNILAQGTEFADKNPQSVAAQGGLARLLLQAGQNDAALERGQRAVSLAQALGDFKTFSWALTARSLAEYAKGDHSTANQDALAALRYDPTNKAAFSVHMLSENRVMPTAGRIAEELAQQNPAVIHSPSQWVAAQKEGSTQAGLLVMASLRDWKQGNLASALDFANRAIALNPDDPMGYVMRAIAYGELGRQTDAFLDADRVIKKGWTSDVIYLLRAKTLFKNRHYRDALYDAEMAVRLNPKAAMAYHTRARASFELHKQLGDLASFSDAFVEDLRTAARLDPRYQVEYEDMRRAVAELHAAQGQKAPEPQPLRLASLPTAHKVTLATLTAGAVACLLIAVILFLRGRSRAAPLSALAQDSPTPELIEGSYHVLRRIGEGGMGVVYEAHDLRLNRRVALKRMSAELHADPEERGRFLAEARIVAGLKHPNIMVVYTTAEEDGRFYLVCEFLAGQSVAELIARKGRLSVLESTSIIRDICAGLGYAHAQGVIHRDLKPSNVMIENGTAKIMDFGLARRTQSLDGRTETVCVMGTPAYMAPEQSFGSVSRESDLYALGVSLYQMLTGRLPFDGPCGQEDKLYSRFLFVGHAGIDAFFQTALAPDRDKRFHSAAEFLEAFRKSVS